MAAFGDSYGTEVDFAVDERWAATGVFTVGLGIPCLICAFVPAVGGGLYTLSWHHDADEARDLYNDAVRDAGPDGMVRVSGSPGRRGVTFTAFDSQGHQVGSSHS